MTAWQKDYVKHFHEDDIIFVLHAGMLTTDDVIKFLEEIEFREDKAVWANAFMRLDLDE